MLTWCIWKCSGCKSDGRLLYSTRLREGERLTETDTLFTLWQRLNSECSFDLSCIISHISTGTIRVYACVSQCICMILGIFKACLQGSSWYICWCQRQRWSAVKATLCLTHTPTHPKKLVACQASDVENLTHSCSPREYLYWCESVHILYMLL